MGDLGKKLPTREKKAMRQATNNAIDKAAACVPKSWLDPILTGEKRVIGQNPYNSGDIEVLLNRIRRDILSLKQ